MLNDIDIIEVTGGDAKDFLQGQLTCDLNTLTVGGWTFAAYCNPNGRVVTFLWLMWTGETFLMCLPGNMSAVFLGRLRKFILRQAVTMTLSKHYKFVAVPLDSEIDVDFFYPFSGLSGLNAFICPMTHNIAGGLTRAAFQAARIRAGIPEIHPETAEKFLPQMLCLDTLGGLSLQKGCYVGQEGIARGQYKTTIRRHLAFAEMETLPNTVEIGASLFTEKGSPAGIVIDFGQDTQGGVIQAIIEDRHYGQHLLLGREESATLIFYP